MDDPGVVGGLDPLSDLRRDVDRVVDVERAAVEPLGERLSLDELEHEVAATLLLLDAVNPADVGVIQARERLGLAFKSFEPRRVGGEFLG